MLFRSREPIIAPFDFGILKTDQKLNKDLDEARNSVPFSFSRNQDFVDNQISAIDTFFIYLTADFIIESNILVEGP